jgi:hypothetical protein
MFVIRWCVHYLIVHQPACTVIVGWFNLGHSINTMKAYWPVYGYNVGNNHMVKMYVIN